MCTSHVSKGWRSKPAKTKTINPDLVCGPGLQRSFCKKYSPSQTCLKQEAKKQHKLPPPDQTTTMLRKNSDISGDYQIDQDYANNKNPPLIQVHQASESRTKNTRRGAKEKLHPLRNQPGPNTTLYSLTQKICIREWGANDRV